MADDNFVSIGGESVATKADVESLREKLEELEQRIERLEDS